MGRRGRKGLAEVMARRNDVRAMMLEGKSKSFIVSYCASNYGIKLSSVEKDITACYKDMLEYNHKIKEEVIAEHIQRYELIYEIFMREYNEDKTLNIFYNPEKAAETMQKKEKLMQLYTIDPLVVINNNTLNVNTYSTEQLQKLKEIIELQP